MTVLVDRLTSADETDYERFVGSIGTTLVYASLKYKRFLEAVVENGAARYLIARRDGRTVGALPAFVKFNERHGNVINSLPFYGSNGGVIVAPDIYHREDVVEALLRAFVSLAREESAVASTLISSPVQPELDAYGRYTQSTHMDERVGQFSLLPAGVRARADIQRVLLDAVHPKTRNSIRKAWKSELTISHSDSAQAMNALAAIHEENMSAMHLPSKSPEVFEAIRSTFSYDTDYRVYVATKGYLIVAALLLFYYNGTVEYFTPATLEGYRLYQPMSALIHEAMVDAACRGFVQWNWGGPGPAQPNIYNFKKRWGAVDRPYRYYVKLFEDSVRQAGKPALLSEYPYFYVIPFAALAESASAGDRGALLGERP